MIRSLLCFLVLGLAAVAAPAASASLPMEIELQAADLSPVKQEVLAQFLEGTACPCGCDKGSLKSCIEKDRACGVSRGFARQAIGELRMGDQIVATRKAVAAYKRPGPVAAAADAPDKVYDIKVGDAPVIGPAHATVTAIAFLDYQ